MTNTFVDDRFAGVTQEQRIQAETLIHWILNEAPLIATIGRMGKRGRCWKVAFNRTPEQERADFWIRVNVVSLDECWNWTGAIADRKDGYGAVIVGRRKEKAHRYAAEQFYGKDDQGRLACHRCDNRLCCNPLHLYFGTEKDNSRDCIAAGRQTREKGSQRYNAKLTEADVAQIRAEAPNQARGWQKEIAKKFGVGPSAISNVVTGYRWRDASNVQNGALKE